MRHELFIYLMVILLVGIFFVCCEDTEPQRPSYTSSTRKNETNRIKSSGIITNSIGMKLKLIPAGTFMMGWDDGEARERPSHEVEITKSFYIGVYEVTQEQYVAIMGHNPSHFKGRDKPVESVSFWEAKEFCENLSRKEGKTYRLPTEAEWEYACRAGTWTEYYWGDFFDGNYSWYEANSGDMTHPVGQKRPNKWGLHDFAGNVWEWCEDYFHYWTGYSRFRQKDPKGISREKSAERGVHRVTRGGDYWHEEEWTRSSWKMGHKEEERWYCGGFRVVLEINNP